MEDLVDLIATDGSSSDISDKMKEVLFAKAAERIDIARPYVANAMFGQEFEYPTEDETEVADEPQDEVVDEVDTESEVETEPEAEEESE